MAAILVMRIGDTVIIDFNTGSICLPLRNFQIGCTHYSTLFPSAVKMKYNDILQNWTDDDDIFVSIWQSHLKSIRERAKLSGANKDM